MSRAKILVVEDETIIALDICQTLEKLGYEAPDSAGTAEEAVAKAEEIHPDLVLMDVILEGEPTGIKAAQHIYSNLNIPVVYLTAHSEDAILQEATTTQPFGYLMKPFRPGDLHSTIEMALFKHGLEMKLKENREWFSVTLSSIADAVVATDRDGLVRFMNPVAQSLTGWPESEAQGRPLAEVFNTIDDEGCPPSGDILEGAMSASATDGCKHRWTTLIARDRSERSIDASVAPIKNSKGAGMGIVVVFRDVTERRQADARLRLLSQAFEQTSEGIAVADMDANVLFLNRAFAEMHGYTPEDVIGKHLSVFHVPEQIPEVDAANAKLKEEALFTGEIWHARSDGTVFPGLMHNSLLRDDRGNLVGMIGSLRDITDIKAAQEALRASHEALAVYSYSLEAQVEDRTRDLETSRAELKRYSESLEKTNEALKIIIEGIAEQKRDVEKRISHNINLSVKPILDQLKSLDTSDTVSFLLKSLEFSLNNMFSSFGLSTIKNCELLTPREMRICEMIRAGLSSKQIAKVMGISPHTVLVHRKHIRKKLALDKSRRNLAAFLKTNEV